MMKRVSPLTSFSSFLPFPSSVMARMQDVDASALKKPILGENRGGTNGGASTSAASPGGMVAPDITEIGPGSISEEGLRQQRKHNWRLVGLGEQRNTYVRMRLACKFGTKHLHM